jgi:two-component system, sensor histidine kinase PdtaS
VSDLEALTHGTSLTAEERDFLRSLISDWQLLADLSFSDLLLWVPLRTEDRSWPDGFRVVAQIRPTTGPTVFPEDQRGQSVRWGDRPHLETALSEERISRDRDTAMHAGALVIEEAIPVRLNGRITAVIGKYASTISARTPSRLELVYLQTANELAVMIAGGHFRGLGEGSEAPRVGDGLVRLDLDGKITYASPNAASALRHLGSTEKIEGALLGELISDVARERDEPTHEGWLTLLSGRAPRLMSVRSLNAVVDIRVIPLLPAGSRNGAIALLHDVTEIHRRDRELVTKSATIREIHHRVKNNLQTVAALLRLQARRLDDGVARSALEEAVRRVGAIAVVHETLSSSGTDETVAFDEVADRVIEMLVQVAARSEVRVLREGSFGQLPTPVATALSMVLNELVSNALEHGVAEQGSHVLVRVEHQDSQIGVAVIDDGVGLPENFDLDASTSLGLQIVQTLVRNELEGTITFTNLGSGTTVMVVIPI